MKPPLSPDEIYERFITDIDAAATNERLATPFWADVCRSLLEDARSKDRADFLRWPSLNNFSVHESWVPPLCYDILRARQDWPTKWFRLTRDAAIGKPKTFSRDAGASPILVQHAYHLLRYESLTGESLVDCDVIFEVGGGYGSFCRLLRNAGFNGVHIIYDLPHVAAIQRLYLLLSGFDETPYARPATGGHTFCLISDDSLDRTFDALAAAKSRIGLVATWSLSEFPLPARTRILPRFLEICRQVLIAYQPEFEGVDNMAYFAAIRREQSNFRWRSEAILPSFYLIA